MKISTAFYLVETKNNNQNVVMTTALGRRV